MKLKCQQPTFLIPQDALADLNIKTLQVFSRQIITHLRYGGIVRREIGCKSKNYRIELENVQKHISFGNSSPVSQYAVYEQTNALPEIITTYRKSAADSAWYIVGWLLVKEDTAPVDEAVTIWLLDPANQKSKAIPVQMYSISHPVSTEMLQSL
ncbi:hypothetical protein ACQ4M3_20695 [Leptolyngbya sp. AN03gr2]|uniref:hypothetical protein n=1 Tax=unclassified Leptolyngbya TaxID=2650499 RepID=UPI003D324332